LYSFFDGDDADAAPTLRRRRRANRRDRRRQRELEEIDDGARLVRLQRVDEAGAPTKHRRRRIDSEKLAGGFDNGKLIKNFVSDCRFWPRLNPYGDRTN
jgi:hypothetical protein